MQTEAAEGWFSGAAGFGYAAEGVLRGAYWGIGSDMKNYDPSLEGYGSSSSMR